MYNVSLSMYRSTWYENHVRGQEEKTMFFFYEKVRIQAWPDIFTCFSLFTKEIISSSFSTTFHFHVYRRN